MSLPGRKRPFAIQIIVSAAEREELQEAAEQNYMSVSSYARSRLLLAMRREAKLEQRLERRLGISDQAETAEA
jgi:hypothetical protein